MPKPAQTPEWASSGDKVEPTAGKKAAGYASNEKPAAQHFNWLFGLIYEWLLWLDSVFDNRTKLLPAASAHAVATYTYHTFPAVVGDARGDNAVLNPSVDNDARWEFDDDTSTGHVSIPIPLKVGEKLTEVFVWVTVPEGTATLTVYRKNLATGGITTLGTPDNSSGTGLQFLESGTLSEVGAIDFAYYANITTTASGGDNLTQVHGGNYAVQYEPAHAYDPTKDAWTGVADLEVHFPVPVVVGETLIGFAARIKDVTSNPVTAKLYRQADGVLTQLGSTQTSAGDGTVQTLSHTLGTPHVVLDGNSYFVKVTTIALDSEVYLAKAVTTLESL